MHHADGGGGVEFQEEVPVGDGVHAVGTDGVEAELICNELAVEGVGDAGEGAAAKGKDGGGVPALLEAPLVSLEHVKIGEEVMGQQDGLGALEVGVAGHDDVCVLLGLLQEGLLEVDGGFDGLPACFHGVEAHVGGDLVVAGAGGVELAGNVANFLFEAGLDVHVDVFEFRTPGESSGFDFLLNVEKAAADGFGFLVGDYALPGQHEGVGNRAANVLAVEAAVVVNGDGV